VGLVVVGEGAESVLFYNRLAEARREDAGQFNIVAAFINKEDDRVKSYADEKHLSVPTPAGVDFDKLGIYTTPTLVLVDPAGKVLDSWSGELQPEGEREVFGALSLPYRPEGGSTSTAVNVKKTADIFDEQKAVLSIRPVENPENDPSHFVEVYDEGLKHVGIDLKFMNPGRSNYVFLNQKVYAPDYGFGAAARVYSGSPLEIPAAPLALKVFDALL
jgi:hypothetical protein